MPAARRRKDRGARPLIEIVPLIDCAFILLIFFAVSTTLITTRAGMKVNLPEAKTAETIPENVQISVREDGKVFFEDVEVGADVEDTALDSLVRKKLDESPDASFIINADGTVPYARLIQVLDVVRGAGAAKLALAAEKKYEEPPQE
ncbi:MAG: biopolymer transporter ExbD [bacterium]